MFGQTANAEESSPATPEKVEVASKAEPPTASTTDATTPTSTEGTDKDSNILIVNKSEKLSDKVRSIRDAIEVVWFKPESVADEKAGTVRISFAGTTKPGTRVYLLSNEIETVKGDKKEKMVLKPTELKYLPGLADPRGVFLFEMTLPPGNYEIPVSFVDPAAQSINAAKSFILLLNVSYKEVVFGFREMDGRDPFTPESDYYAFGGGLNYAVYNKSSPEVPAEVRFSSFKIPSLRFGYAKTLDPKWRFNASLLFAPGETQNGSRVPVKGGSYIWTNLNADGIYSKETWKKTYGRYRVRYGVRTGLQLNSIPFLASTTKDDNTQSVQNVSMNYLSVGAQADIMTDDGFSYEVFMRAALPGLLMSSIDAKDLMSIDGSIGGMYFKKKSAWGYGLYWYGNWMKFSFSEKDAYSDKNVSGTSDILFSNLEFRVLYKY